MRNSERATAVWVCLVVVLAAGHSSAQEAEGYALNILDSAGRGSEWFGSESLDLRGHGRTSFGFAYDWSHRPLLVEGLTGGRARAVVRNQMFVQPGASVILWEYLRLSLDLPVLIYSDGNTLSHASVRYLAPPGRVGLGDVRLGALLRLFGTHGGPLTGALGVNIALPTGKENAYTGDGAVRVMPQLAFAGDYAGFTYAGRLGVGLRGASHDLLGAHQGHYAYFTLAVGVRMFERRLVLGPELFGLTGLGRAALFKRHTTPVEALLGLHYSFDHGMRVGAAIGFGLTQGLGAPEQRGVVTLEWNVASVEQPPLAAELDRDGDGVIDREDACADEPGRPSAHPSLDGCPLAVDSDGDGVHDSEDACPEHPGAASDDPEQSGCPKPKDSDRDGVPDAQDACPGEAGVVSADPQATGCPEPAELAHEDAK